MGRPPAISGGPMAVEGTREVTLLNQESTGTTLRRSLKAGASVAAMTACAVLTLGVLQPASAQEKDKAKDANTVGEVVVTAQFRAQNLQQTPIAITALNASMMDERSYTKISDLTQAAPNVQLQQNPSGFGNSMRAFIRGVGQSDFNPAVDPGVGIYVDDVYYASLTGSIFDLLDLDRVEILRGPQGTLSGMNSLGGSVKLYSKAPRGSGGFIEGTVGSLGRRDFRASGDFTVVPDKLFVRLSGVARHHSGYVDRIDYACSHPNDPYVISGALPVTSSNGNCKIGEMGDQAFVALRAAVRWVVSDNIEDNFVVDGTRDNSHTTASTLLGTYALNPILLNPLQYQGVPFDNRFVPANPYISYANYLNPGVTYTPSDPGGTPGKANGISYTDPSAALKAWGLSNNLDIKLGDGLTLKSITGYRQYTSHAGADNDNSPVDLQSEQSVLSHHQFSEELRLNGEMGKLLDYTVGGIYMKSRTTYQARVGVPFAPSNCNVANFFGVPNACTYDKPTFDFIQDDPVNTTTYAFFAHTVLHLTDQLNLSSGIRYTKEKKGYTFYRFNVDGLTPYLPLSDPNTPANNLNGYTGTFEGSHIDYRVNLDYQVTHDILTYAQFSTGFKGGGVNSRPYHLAQVIPFKPETLNAYEVGLKSQWLERRVTLNLAAFYNQYHNYQGLITSGCVGADGQPLPPADATPCGETLNVANAKVKGAEAELGLRPIDGMLIDGSLSYLDFKFGQPFVASTGLIAGQGAPGIGKWKWAIGAQYEVPFIAGGSLTPRVDVSHIPGYCGNIACDPLVSNTAYNLFNARLTYRAPGDDWSVALEVTNFTNKLYYLSKFDAGAGFTDGQPGMPREWAVTLRKTF